MHKPPDKTNINVPIARR